MSMPSGMRTVVRVGRRLLVMFLSAIELLRNPQGRFLSGEPALPAIAPRGVSRNWDMEITREVTDMDSMKAAMVRRMKRTLPLQQISTCPFPL